MHSPFFSIIIPVYNGGVLFEHCLQALHQSDFTDWELIVVDDGSTDGSDRLAAVGARLYHTGRRWRVTWERRRLAANTSISLMRIAKFTPIP
jgi:glycosyltransferase involved in cell wall biosynthesis